MDPPWLDAWFGYPVLGIGAVLVGALILAALLGTTLRNRRDRGATGRGGRSETQEGYIVTGVLGLLALLLGFTFALAVDRFEARRLLVLDSANAIGTTYLRAQLLPEPHRTRISRILVAYTENAIELGEVKPGQGKALVAEDDRLLTDLWAATAAGFDSVKNLDFSSSVLETTNNMIDLDAARRAARGARVPSEVFGVLFVYIVVTAGVLGYVLTGYGGRVSAALLLALTTLSLLLVIDIDRPTSGGIREAQTPMVALREGLRTQPSRVFDRYRTPADEPGVASKPRLTP
jgi:hypothetical protein